MPQSELGTERGSLSTYAEFQQRQDVEELLSKLKVKPKDPLVLDAKQEDRVMEYAKRAVRAGIVPVARGENPEITVNKAFCAMVFGIELGLTRQQALSNVAVVNQRPSLMSKIKLGICLQRCKFDERPWKEEIDLDAIGTKDAGRATVVWRCVRDGKAFEGYFSMADAQRAGLLRGAESGWGKYPRDMLSHRAMSRCLDIACADVLMGADTTEELQSIPTPTRDETPPLPAPLKKGKNKWKEPDAKSTSPDTTSPGRSKKETGQPVGTVRGESSGPESTGLPGPTEKGWPATGARKAGGTSQPLAPPGPSRNAQDAESASSPLGDPFDSGRTTAKQFRDDKEKKKAAGLPTPNGRAETREARHERMMRENAEVWEEWKLLSPHLSDANMADIRRVIPGGVYATMEKPLLLQAIARAKYHLGPKATQILKSMNE